MHNKIAIIDLDSVLFTAIHPNKKLDEFDQPIRENNKFVYVDKSEAEVKAALDSIMNNILSVGRFDSYIAFIKGRNTVSSRKIINPDYKANRPTEQPQHWEFVKAYAKESWDAITVDNMEVDDAVNITRLNIKDSYMVGIDKDLLGLEGTHYNWKTNEWITVTSAEADRKFWSDMICGQSGDNIPGLFRKGAKYVEELFKPQIIAHPAENIEIVAPYYVRVLQAYYEHYKEFGLALEEYRKTYKCLKILDSYEGFEIPEPMLYGGRMS